MKMMIGLMVLGASVSVIAENVTVVTPLSNGGVSILSNSDKAPLPATPAKEKEKGVKQASKARIMVVPATYAVDARSKFERELYDKLGLSDPSAIENVNYSGQLIDSLVNCRKFDVLERESLREVARELDFGESAYANIEKCTQMGNMVNADYVVIPTIRYINLITEEREIAYVGGASKEYTIQIGTQLRVVDVNSSRIATSNMDELEIKKREPRKAAEKVKLATNLLTDLYAESARQQTEGIIDSVYPIKVLAIAGGELTINRGKGSLKPGEKLTLFRAGEELIDPDTGESLGSHEIELGIIEVKDIKPRFSTASIVSLEEGQSVQKNDIARRVKQVKEAYQRKNVRTKVEL